MGTPNKSAEELQRELEAEQAATQAAIDEAAAAAGEEAAKKGASPDEVKDAVERARKEEKDKLYPQLTALKDSIKDIQETLRAEREEKERIKAEADAEKERRRQEKLSDSERTLEAIRKLEEKLELERQAREASDRRWQEAQQKQEVDKYRAQVIAAADGEIIEEIVSGSTVEEVDRTAQIAKARFAELAERFKNVQGNEVRRNLSRTSTNPDTAALEEQDINENLTAVDQDKYLKDPAYRQKIQQTLANEYARLAGRT